VKARLVRLMTSSSMPLNVASANFLFNLCKRDGKKFTRHVGMANAAGVLGQMGVFGQDGVIVDTESEGDVEDDEDYNPVTGARQDPGLSPSQSMTEEEKEAEAERLVHLFDRLNKTGVIQVMSQDANGNQVPFNPMLGVSSAPPPQQPTDEDDDD